MLIKKDFLIKKLKGKSQFEKTVLLKTYEIPLGKVSTYKRIAGKIGRPQAYRAVATALKKNPLAPIIPCHRVVRSNGKIVGGKESVRNRRKLLEKEGIPLINNSVILNKYILF